MDSTYRDYGFTGFDKAVVVDVETTGLDPRKDRIVSIACLRGSIAELATTGSTRLDQFTARLNPGIPIPREATRVHGIKDRDIAAEDTFADIAIQLRQFIAELPLIGHNVSYDKAFLSNEFKRAGQRSLHRNKSYCTMKRLREHFGYSEDSWRNMSLNEAACRFGLKRLTEARHDATEDAMLALQLAGGLYQLDNGLASARGRTHEHPGWARPPSMARARTNLILLIVLSLLAAGLVLLIAL
jgi:DNA polymerase III epsilon subunit family exonuclease